MYTVMIFESARGVNSKVLLSSEAELIAAMLGGALVDQVHFDNVEDAKALQRKVQREGHYEQA